MSWAARSVFTLLAGLGVSSCGGFESGPAQESAVIVRGAGVEAAFVQSEDGTVRAFFAPDVIAAIDADLVLKQGGEDLPLNPDDAFGFGDDEDGAGFRVQSGSTGFSGSTGASTRFSATTGGSGGFDGRTVRGTSFERALRSPRVSPTCDLGILCSFVSSPADASMCRRGVREALIPVRLDGFLCAFVDFFQCAVGIAGVATPTGDICLPELRRVINEGIRAGLFEPSDFRR